MAIFAVKADYLYWMVTNNPDNQTWENYVGQTITFDDWSRADLYYNGDSFSGGTLAGTMTRATADTLNSIGAYAYSSIGDSYDSSTTFFIELYSDNTYLGRAMGSYSDVAAHIFKDNSMAPLGTGWVPTAYAIPEPTSGLLFLLGGMLLGLKRRRQV